MSNFTPEEELHIGRIIEAAVKRGMRPRSVLQYGRLAACINEAGRRLQEVNYDQQKSERKSNASFL